MKKFQANNWKLAFAMITNYFTFSIGVFVIFMLHLGLSLSQVSIVISTFLMAYAIGQIPAGIFADRLGYKTALTIGGLILLLGTVLFAFSQGFWWFLIGYGLIGIGSAMKQGADQALLYEGLKHDRLESKYKKLVGRLELIGNSVWALTAVIGGFLYTINERLPFYGEVIVVFISLLVVLTLKEPSKEQKHFPVIEQIKTSVKKAFATPNFSKIFIFSALIGSIAITTFQYLQPLYKEIGIPETYFGLIAAGCFLIRGFGASSAEKVGKMFAVDKYIVLHASIFGLFLLFMQSAAHWLLVLIIVAIFYYLRGLYVPTISTYINDKVDSSSRATMLSVNDQLLTLISSISLFITGLVSELYGFSATFYAISIGSMAFLILYVLVLRKVEAD